MNTLFLLLFFASFVVLIVGLVKPNTFSRFIKGEITRKKIMIIFGIATIASFVLFDITADTSKNDQVAQQPGHKNQVTTGDENQNLSPSSSLIASSSALLSSSSKSETHDEKSFDVVFAFLNSYKLPLQSGKWRTCVAERINALSNLQLLSFYEWVKSLSSYASELSQLVAISRKLGCPEPVEKTIPAKVELLKSWNGAGAKTLEIVSNIPSPWQVSGSWSQKETIGHTDSESPYGIFICDPDERYEDCSLLAAGFFSRRTSGNFYATSDGYDFLKGTFYLKIEPNPADPNPSWSIKLEKIIEPAKTIVE
jgi:hypothetical protein